MKSIILSLFTVLISLSVCFGQSDFYGSKWRAVYKYESLRRPQSALGVVDTIYARAKQENNMLQLTKSLMYQSKFVLTLQEEAELQVVQKFKNEINESNPPFRNILESVLASVYLDYLKENYWSQYHRSKTSDKINKEDFRTWDAQTMLNEINRHFQNSLQDAALLQKTDLAIINDLLVQADNSKKYRPTLYDFLAHSALDFYKSDESFIRRPIVYFKLKDPRYFEDFESLTIVNPDTLAPALQALKIFQDLLAFHKKAKDTTAYINLETERLAYIADEGVFENKTDLHKNALTDLQAIYLQHPSSTLLDFELASLLYNEGEQYKPFAKTQPQFKKKEALSICNNAIMNFPESAGAKKCQQLSERILNSTLAINGEKYVPTNTLSRASIEYSNIDSLFLVVYPVTQQIQDSFDIAIDSEKLSLLQQLVPTARWHVTLKNMDDYQAHRTEVILPKLAQGKYLLLASNEDFTHLNPDKFFTYTFVQVTNLALIEINERNNHHYQVIDRNNGKPFEGARVQIQQESSEKDTIVRANYTTDKDGFFYLDKSSYSTRIQVNVSYQGDEAVFGNYYVYSNHNKQDEERITAKVFLFTDRSIYRPGQTVYFKGILVKTKNKKSSIVSGEYVSVTFEDVNDEEAGSLRLKTNSFGSFSGEFKLPASGLTGQYTINVDEDSVENDFYRDLDNFYNTNHGVSVEEYKRPTFETSFKTVKETFRVYDSIRVTATAIAYSGSKVSKAKVHYRVRRESHFPRWNYIDHRPYHAEEQEIAFGEGTTDNNGEFSVRFKAIPDEAVSKSDKPVFYYVLTVDVTDINGETRSSTTTVKVGYHTMQAILEAAEIVDKKKPENTIDITTENLNGQFVPAKGAMRIYKLQFPAVPLRERPWKKPDLPTISKEEFHAFFPHDAYEDEGSVATWKNGKLMAEIPFNTASSSKVIYKTDQSWELGRYIIELVMTDPDGQEVEGKHRFEVIETGSRAVPDNRLLTIGLDKSSYKVGELARLKVCSASPDITVTIEVEKENGESRIYTQHIADNCSEITIPITGDMGQELAIHCGAAFYNSRLYSTQGVPIIEEIKNLEIETITFKDKLQPGAKETWSFGLKEDGQPKKDGEMLASMYDASLDQFMPHQWSFNYWQHESFYSRFNFSADESFGDEQFVPVNPTYNLIIPPQFYDQLDWFGFNITEKDFIDSRYLHRLYASHSNPDKPSVVIVTNARNKEKGFIYGKITTSDNRPLPGVNIVIKGTTRGTRTDNVGNYKIKAAKDETLIYSFVGYATAQATVGKKNTINVIMNEDGIELAEIVITGYGIQRKRDITGSIAYTLADSTLTEGMIFSETVEGIGEVVFEEPVENGSGSLQGKVAGVSISSRYSYASGSAYHFTIRGNSSFAASSTPLYVVDGVLVEAYEMDPQAIASIQVLKDKEATSLYGSRGASGVIIINTKAGQAKLDAEMAKVNTRKNLNETAFFFPHLTTDENGKVRFTFTTPEALTRWKLQLLAHTRDLSSSIKSLQTITQKELMVTPNMPRFLRVGDKVIVSAKIANLTGQRKEGKAALQLFNAVTGESIDQALNNVMKSQSFHVDAKGTTEVSWSLKVPEGVDAVQYKIVAKAGNFSDGEQNALPVLSNRMMVTETMPMYVRSGQTKTFSLEKLKTVASPTLQHHKLTLEITSNPAWYGIQALPYLMEFPYDCAEQIFSRVYANTLASHVVSSSPKIKEVFNKWSSSKALISNLEKNQDLKSLILQETPWLRDAQNETEQKKRIALLFDINTMKDQLGGAINKLQGMQLGNGGFPWFSGGNNASGYITQHIVSGFGHMKKLGIPETDNRVTNLIANAIAFLDREMVEQYEQIAKEANAIRAGAKNAAEVKLLGDEFMHRQHVSNNDIHYLYMRSFFPEIRLSEKAQIAVDYYRNQSAVYWKEFNLYLKGMIALTQHRNQNKELAETILISLRENSIVSDELGMYWKENKPGWYWHESPVETQALLIEAFTEIEQANTDRSKQEKMKTIDDLRVWLLKNKQANQWKTTKATAEAVYALLLNGTDWLSLDNQVNITIGTKNIEPDAQQPEVGTGYFKTEWSGKDVAASMNTVTLTKKDEGIAWGGLYWQYFEDMDKVTSAETPLALSKKVFLVSHTNNGEILNEVHANIRVKVGDLLRVRIELKTDRAMEFLHMKDMRASGLEPVDVISGYKWQDGLGYYQSTKDASTNFFFDDAPKGVYVFEYDLRVNNKGDFSNGITTIQSMYAPEFSSHSEGIRISVE